MLQYIWHLRAHCFQLQSTLEVLLVAVFVRVVALGEGQVTIVIIIDIVLILTLVSLVVLA